VKGTVVGTDPSDDLAVVRAQGITNATPATLGSSSSLHVADTVLAIGSPLGLEGSVSAGIVSALHRILDEGSGGARIADAIQTDAAINPGNSGGALLDASGKVVGINTAIATLGGSSDGSSQSGSIGVGFAIPIDLAKQVVADILAGKTPSHAQLGVQVSDAQGGGALLASVTSGSAADKAGLKAGDVITRLGSTDVTDGDTLASAVRAYKAGQQVQVTYTRAGASRTVTVTLGSSSSS
jgi:putative serine protease PepD